MASDLPPEVVSSSGTQTDDRPTMYLMEAFHPVAVAHCQTKFRTILHGTPEFESWRENARYLLIKSAWLTAEDVASCKNLIAVGKQGVGLDRIDEAACAARGVKVFNTPGINARTVAELTLGLTIAVARDVRSISVRQAAGEVVPKETCDGIILHKKTVGIVGMGNIGTEVARIFRGAFESPIVAYDPYVPAHTWSAIPHTRASSLDDVLRNCDVLTIHCPLTPETRGMIAYPQLKMMGRSAILINAARGGIVNEDDLEKALSEKLLWGAGLDCHEEEPPPLEKYKGLWAQRVTSTPHIGAATSEMQALMAMTAINYVYDFIEAAKK